MDLACVVRRSFPGPGGIATMLRTVTAGIAARGHEVRVVAARIDDAPVSRLNATLNPQRFEPFTLDGVSILPAPSGIATRAGAAPMALATIRGLRSLLYEPMRGLTAGTYVRTAGAALAETLAGADVVHAWGGEHLPWASGAAAERMGVPLAVTPFAHPGAWGDDDLNAAFYARADAVLCLVRSEADIYERLGVAPNRLHVVGVPVTARPPAPFDARERYAIGEAPLVLYLGVKAVYKGYRTMLRGMRDVWSAVPDARAAFIGPRTSDSQLDFGGTHDHRIVEVGEIPDAEVTAWLEAADVLCLPSSSEILPVTILDAWAHGKPVVAGRWWCAGDLIDDGADGTIANTTPQAVAEALLGYLRDRDRAREHGEAGRKKVQERYTADAVTERHLRALPGSAG